MGDVDQPPAPVPVPTALPGDKVVVNGAAVNLISVLVESVRADMRAMETRFMHGLAERFDAHEEMHDVQRIEDLDFQRRARERLAALEEDDKEDDMREAAKVAHRAGQLWMLGLVPKTLVQLEKYSRLILVILAALVGAILSAASGVIRITIGQ